ncbi:putative transcription factor interactor and regulator Znf-B family [Helianthus annuus]|uniref:Transcription factor interactor and regulator Znf-B family n=1 Tax=Helianthus annuus TaxID=4232 RepID=A0A9K3DX52_HELAN|nr:putative transcription factor interactor and regulator Znf-B family [Helianthus annuus]KAJ0440288.1 putative transcription factor interactor and regulator Znf-B family [Helianthus annuus]KAJ0462671.1 putative transcription factor interactor and regulator Znf-B family [Helianthus annuus]KAJ0643060.1 putative transcription factor interactor and regulator Znf-B family [Helianthus annuus]KAJ0646925.1 putative transcription factor interactor and regulator Znf-B family [Helianthus annuus]
MNSRIFFKLHDFKKFWRKLTKKKNIFKEFSSSFNSDWFSSDVCVCGHDGVWWLYLFLGRTFFLACDRHPGNNQNRYCIDCDMAACPHCIAEGNHASHRVLNIYRLVYKDVVSVDQMSTHIDCSRIQVCNRIIV